MAASILSLNTITYAADYFPYEIRGRAMGWIFSSYFAALILGVPLGSFTGDLLGWGWVFLGAALLAGIYSLVAGAILPPSRILERPARTRLHLFAYLEFFTAGPALGALLCSFFVSAGMMGFIGFVGVWLHDSFGVSPRGIGLIFLVSGVAALLGSPMGGALSDRIGKKTQLVASSAVLALLVLLLPGMAWDFNLMLLFCGISLAAAFRQGPMEALMTEVVEAGRRGTFVALKNSFSQLGIGLAALASGALMEASGYTAVCALSAILNLAAAGAALWLMRRAPA
jgi:predicted MFS family arabinose efflux permease